MTHLFYLFLIFIILIILELVIWYYSKIYKRYFFSSHAELDTIFNYKKGDEEKMKRLDDEFKRELNDRMKKLDELGYQDWIMYNKRHIDIEFEGDKYYFFIFEDNNFENQYTLRCNATQEIVDLDYSVIEKLVAEKYVILKLFPPLSNLPQTMYSTNLNEDGFNNIYYNWEDPYFKRPVKKKSVYTKFDKDKFKGVIGIGYTVYDLDVQLGDLYFNIIDTKTLIFVNIAMFFVSIILYLLEYNNNSQFFMSAVVLVAAWTFLISQLVSTTTVSNLEVEENKTKEISTNILGASFLIGVNIFIINLLNTAKKSAVNTLPQIKKGIMFLFFVVVLFLLLSLFKFNNYLDIYSLRSLRSQSQLFFNYSIFYNIVICSIFIYYLLNNFKVFNIIKNKSIFYSQKKK